MSRKIKCPNGCKFRATKQLLNDQKQHFYFGYSKIVYCPKCGVAMPDTQKTIQSFLELYRMHPRLENALDLIYKSEYIAAAREAAIVLEAVIKHKANLPNLRGKDLVAKAFSMEVDKLTGNVTTAPLISFNSLSTISEKNEHDGMKFMLMGFFQGARNIYLHNEIGTSACDSLAIVLQVSFFLRIIDGASLTKKARWVKQKTNLDTIYANMPRRFDRFRFRILMKRSNKQFNKEVTENASLSDDTNAKSIK